MIQDSQLIAYINVKLALIGCQPVAAGERAVASDIVSALAAQFQEKDRLLGQYLCPADQRIQSFLYDYLHDVPTARLPLRTFTLDQPGLARALSLPVDRDDFSSDIIRSYRVKQGVLHNPRSDRRTTQGIFHVTEGGLPIPDDKLGVPRLTFAKMLALALNPPQELMQLPFTATQAQPAECFVSLLLRPIICPEVPGFTAEKTMEVRFFAPGNLVSNLDFVESIFGNGGDPMLPENDAGLDAEHWSGHTGCVILAPHLVRATKRSVGLPHWDQATERQRRDGMCWKQEEELYNNGGAFKLTCRDESGVIVTIIADNYYGYCKKEVKTQISYAANLYGLCEEEHAGGALVFPSYDLGEEFSGDIHVQRRGHSFVEVSTRFADVMHLQPEGYGVDKKFPEIVYVPENARFDLNTQRVYWNLATGERCIKLSPEKTYVRPSGYKVRMEKPPGVGRQWRLVGVAAEGTFCHKPSTVSGGGKSEISKPITDAILVGPVFVADLKADFDRVAELVNRDYSDRFLDPARKDPRSVLAAERSLGSVIKLLTPDRREYTPAYNDWLETLPQHVKELVFVLKRYYKPEWKDNWREHFTVDIINGTPANELKCNNRKLVTTYLRVGFAADGSWRTFGLRKDFHPSVKLQMEDDISASVVVPADRVEVSGDTPPAEADEGMAPSGTSFKFVTNCELRLFQRPDDAIHRGYDKQTEADFSQPDNFFSNYEPLFTPVNVVLPGRRNNPPEAGIRPLAVFNPIHYFELPELFLEFICSMTGKSPSTTGAGSEGALTKGPFNALPPIMDLNNALVSWLLTGHHGFVTAAGYVGPKVRVDHDVSLIVPEVFCRMSPEERDPQFLIANHFLEKCADFEHQGRKVLASRLGYRINVRFVHAFFGRVFNHPHSVFTEEMLKPELQSVDIFVDGMDNIVSTQKRVAEMYFADGSIRQACPPLAALLHIMCHDQWEGKGLEHPDVRRLFTRENLLASDWYAARLQAKQAGDRQLWRRHIEYLDKFQKRASHASEAVRLGVPHRLVRARKHLEEVESAAYLAALKGTIGAEPVTAYAAAP